MPGDTCQLTVNTSRTVTAAFTALGTVGDRVWRDVNVDGVQGPSEPGLDGVSVSIDDGNGLTGAIVTGGGGLYHFVDVPPGTYTLTVDTQTLPPGTIPSFDADGINTPNTAVVELASGEEQPTVDFGYQPLTDLQLTLSDSQDPLPGGETLLYNVTVQNFGPGISTNVQVHGSLPMGTTLIATDGCAEDPSGSPTCSLGPLDIGQSAGFTVEVSIDPAPPASIIYDVDVSSLEVDVAMANNSAAESTELDARPPRVVLVGAVPPTADSMLAECETVPRLGIEALQATFDEPMIDLPGDASPGDVTNPASWSLVTAGANAQLDTFVCGPPGGDDIAVTLDAVAYEPANQLATLHVAGGAGLQRGLYRLLACGSGDSVATDLAGNGLDGDSDGVIGGDFLRRFRADPANLLANSDVDCDLGGWTLLSDDVDEIVYSPDDVDGSNDSGSFVIENLKGGTEFTIQQCVPLEGQTFLDLSTRLRLQATDLTLGIELGCAFYSADDCLGPISGTLGGSTLYQETDNQWIAQV